MAELLTIVLATSNSGKLAELRALLADLPIQFLSAQDVLGEKLTIIEDGATFEENALIKARAVCRATRLLSLADDSGLEVDALGGRPGVRSARFAHERATDAENNAALLRELENVEEGARGARFRCVLSLVSPWQESERYVAEGSCEGSIARAPRGNGGFGYDPLFVVAGQDGRAMAELSEDDKNRISHRALAVRQLRDILIRLVNERLDEAERIAG
ncbi:MAG TPA: RdgB/HAM1 family non-canonical purine NTP pyrophosphatase [Polyangiaceae bacterium]|jgi:XTP/dITP diphosphohydrolase|nr:RdgB/HAM1 family non-canonical purine NTP pyrophosphatase [Polyangiaceae bacterium]